MILKQPILIGIDWADAKHDFHLLCPDGDAQTGVFAQSPQAITDQLKTWRSNHPGAQFAVAIEASKGALINALLQFDDVVIYPVNPAALAYLRKSHRHGGGKSDPVDAKRIAEFLRERIDELRPLHQDSPLTRELARLSEDRRFAVDARADLANELTALIKQYYPVISGFAAAKPYASFLLSFLIEYPTLDQAQAAGEAKLRSYFHGLNMKRKADHLAKLIMDAKPLTTEEVTLRCSSKRAVMIAEQLKVLNKHIRSYEANIKELLPQHPQYAVAASLPGVAANTQARIIAAMGDGEGRYETAQSLQCASGIAPITEQSGKRKFVSARWACTKFLRQTFHEMAGLSVTKSRWAKAFYEDQKAKGKPANTAKRALAYKWQRILFRCW
ncbi:IS110 family transposase [Rhodopirellula sp. SWK7]|uniref:IS110 family transposase n=1 Tax=Rhodopirellula sp. SWK7 TaxID=595460 RepID=UPI0002BEB544|nr:IS110 family transposase [Rhodopirellula sp. SWK7]EMI41693.1 transposase IS111A/IS1328/IS1533 [Rhodopirellula sp. SWK7]